MNILITGATGFLGKFLVDELASQTDRLYLIIRPHSLKKAQEFFQKYPNVICYEGDVSHPDLFPNEKERNEVLQNIDGILHAAAFYDLEGSYTDSYLPNVVGTQNVLFFASRCLKLRTLDYVSTIAVAGDYQGLFLEENLEGIQKFSNHYSKTKYSAEILVRRWHSEHVQKRIYRPGIIVGHSLTGEMDRVDGPYYFFRLLKKYQEEHPYLFGMLRYLPLPYNSQAQLPLVPVDWVSRFIAQMIVTSSPVEKESCYHLFAKDSPTIKEFLKDTFEAFNIKAKPLPLPKNPLNSWLMNCLRLPPELLTYMYGQCRYDQHGFEKKLLNGEAFFYRDFKKSFFDYAAKKMRYS